MKLFEAAKPDTTIAEVLARLDAEREATAIVDYQREVAAQNQTQSEGSLTLRLERVLSEDDDLRPAVRAVLERHLALMESARRADDRMARARAKKRNGGVYGSLRF